MRIPTDLKQREDLLRKLREAVLLQVALWDALLLICEAVDRDHTWVSDHVCAMAITADTGMELSHEDLDDLLGIGAPGRIVTSKPLNRFDGGPGRPWQRCFGSWPTSPPAPPRHPLRGAVRHD
jgi:hypothetical protein